MFVANGDAVAVNATGVEITPGGAACIHRRRNSAKDDEAMVQTGPVAAESTR